MRSDQDHQQLTRIRNAAVGHQFGQEDAEAPDAALDAEPAVVGSLGRGPLDGEPGADPGLVLVLLDQPRQPEVSDLHDIVVTHQNISRRKVPGNLRFNKILKTVMFTYTYECNFVIPNMPCQLPLELTYLSIEAVSRVFLCLGDILASCRISLVQ